MVNGIQEFFKMLIPTMTDHVCVVFSVCLMCLLDKIYTEI